MSIESYLDKLVNSDSDIRFMGLSDLYKHLCNEPASLDDRLTNSLLKTFQDSNSEVQNMALKCLTPLCSIKGDFRGLVKGLKEMVTGDARSSDVGMIGIRVVVSLVDNLSIIEDILQFVIKRLEEGEGLDELEVCVLILEQRNIQQKDALTGVFLRLLGSRRMVVWKKCVAGLAALSIYLDELSFEKVVSAIIKHGVDRESGIQCITAVYRQRGLGVFKAEVIKLIMNVCEQGSEDVRECGLNSLGYLLEGEDTLVPKCLNLAVDLISFDPNYIDSGSSDEMASESEESEEDDDLSWKVRRAAVKLIGSLITKHGQYLAFFYTEICPKMISRFKEREEIVRLEVITVLNTIINRRLEVDSRGKRRRGSEGFILASDIQSHFDSILLSLPFKNIKNEFQLLESIVKIGTLSLNARLLEVLNGSLKASSSEKFEGLELILLMVERQAMGQHIPHLMNGIVTCSSDPYYKVRGKALEVISKLDLIVAKDELFDVVYEVVESEVEMEVIQIGLKSLSVLVSPLRMETYLRFIMAKLRIESTQNKALEVLSAFNLDNICLDNFIDFILTSVPLSTKLPLNCLLHLLKRSNYPHLVLLVDKLLTLLADKSDLPLAFELLSETIKKALSSKNVDPLRLDSMYIQIIDLIIHHTHFVAGGQGLDSLLTLFNTLFKYEQTTQVYEALISPLLLTPKLSKEAQVVISICISTARNSVHLNILLHGLSARMQVIDLLSLSELAILPDASLLSTLTTLIDTETTAEEIKVAASVALGKLGGDHLNLLLDKPGFHYLNSLKVMLSSPHPQKIHDIIWNSLFIRAGKESSILSECLGRIVALDASTYLAKLDLGLKSLVDEERGLSVDIIRYALIHSSDPMLKPYVDLIVTLLVDPSRVVRKASVVALYALLSSTEYSGTLVNDYQKSLSLLLAFQKSEVEVIMMGPFMHKVDHGLDTRKVAFECVYVLVTNDVTLEDCVFGKMVEGLKDPALEVQLVTHLVLKKLTAHWPSLITLDSLVDGLKAVIEKEDKSNAVKQEIESSQRLRISALTVVREIERSVKKCSLSGNWTKFVNTVEEGKWEALYKDCM